MLSLAGTTAADTLPVAGRMMVSHGGSLHLPADTLSVAGEVIIGNGELPHACLLNDWGITASFLAAMAAAVFCILTVRPLKRWFVGHLRLLASFVFLAGVGLYVAGFNDGGCHENAVALVLRAMLSSLEMFVSHSDLIEVKAALHHDGLYMTVFALVHFCAVLVSAVFILRLFGLRFASWLNLCLWRWVKAPEAYYVFWGVDDHALSVAKSLRRANGGTKIGLVFVGLPHGEGGHATSRLTFSHFFRSADDRADRHIGEIEEIDGLLLHADKPLSSVSPDGGKTTVYNLFGRLGASRMLGRLIGKAAAAGCKVEYFFLSDDEQANVAGVVALKKLDGTRIGKDDFRCYCHARTNGVTRMLSRHGGLKYRIHLVDSSSLAVVRLKKEAANHPVTVVGIDRDEAVATTPFTGMVIGFGETGRDAFRFLYEFSAFVRDGEGHENPRTIHVVDRDLANLKADFLKDAPALKAKSGDAIDWWEQVSSLSEAFGERLHDMIDRLNYVVVAVGDDREGLSLALALYEFAYRHRADVSRDEAKRFRIFVRLRKLRIADVLPRCIVPFGADEDIFRYDTLSVDVLEKSAMRFFYEYMRRDVQRMERAVSECRERLAQAEANAAMPGGGEAEATRREIDEMDAQIAAFRRIDAGDSSAEAKQAELWRFRREYKFDRNRCGYVLRTDEADDIEVEYQEGQDRSNAWHAATKRALAGAGAAAVSARAMTNLSSCEHLRWNARMELSGFLPGEEKNFRTRTHRCLVDCATLKEKYAYTIPYDRAVVELSLCDGPDDGGTAL